MRKSVNIINKYTKTNLPGDIISQKSCTKHLAPPFLKVEKGGKMWI